jgi:probable HAF family extracellular repeat protein
LGTLGGYQSAPRGLNDLGQVVGESTTATGEWHAFLWEDGVMTDLGTLGGSYSAAYGINNVGQVVGGSRTATSSWERAFLWQDGAMTELAALPGTPDPASRATLINDVGQIVGSCVSAEDEWHSCLWAEGSAPVDLGTLGGYEVEAWAINDLGQVVGRDFEPWRPFLWQSGTMTSLDTLFGSEGEANDISDTGLVVGSSNSPEFLGIATLWTVPLPPATPEEAIADAVAEVAGLVDAGTLGQGEANALVTKLDAAQRQLDKGNIGPALNVLAAFINQVDAMVNSGRLTAEEAQPLIDAATAAIEMIGEGP